MTTTMLSSKPKSDKRLFDSRFWGLYKTTVRQNLLAVILYTVCLMLVTVLPTYSQSYNSTPTTAYDHYLLSSSYGFGFVGLIVPVLVAAVVFHYLHDRLSVDFYHSMPVSRTKLFFAKYCAGLDMLLAPVCLAKLLCILCHLAFYSGVFSTGHILYVGALDFLFYMIMYTAVYTLSCLVAVTSSTVVETVLYSAALNGAPTVLWLILVNIGNDLYGVRIDSYLLNDISPYETIITFIDNFSYADSFPVFMLKAPLMWLAISVAALFLCVHMYKRFHSEWAQMWGRQSVFAQIMKTLAGILVAFILSLTVMASLTDSITTRYVLSALIGAPLGFLLVEGATGKGFMNLGKNLKYIALTTVVCLCAPLFIATDGFGMVSRVPSIDSVKEISLNPPMAWTNYNQYLYTRDAEKPFSAPLSYGPTPDIILTEERSKEILLQLHQNAIEEQDSNIMKGNRSELTYDLKHFGHMGRAYSFAAKDIPLLVELICQDEYIKQTEPVFTYRPEFMSEVKVTDSVEVFSGSVSSDRYQQLIEALQSDLLNRTPDTIYNYSKDPVVGYVSWTFKKAVFENIGHAYSDRFNDLEPLTHGASTTEIRSSYENTLALLHEWNIHPESTKFDSVQTLTVMMPEHQDININITQLDYIYHSYGKDRLDTANKNLCWQVDDTELIEKIIASSSSAKLSLSCNPVVVEISDTATGVRYVSRYIENSTLLSILEGSEVQVPYLLSSEELDCMSGIARSDNSSAEIYEMAGDKFDLFDLNGRTSVADYARQNNLDWFTGKTTAQLDAMEKTAFTLPDGQMIFYNAYLGYFNYN